MRDSRTRGKREKSRDRTAEETEKGEGKKQRSGRRQVYIGTGRKRSAAAAPVCVGLKQDLKRLKCGGEPYLDSLLRFNGGECLKYRRAGFRNSV